MRTLTVLIIVYGLPGAPHAATAQQKRDPAFRSVVAKPAYTEHHPRVLFDEAHQNFHTTDGRYKPFVELIASDGYRFTPNRQKFSAKLLEGYDILLIANAKGAETLDDPRATESPFTASECDRVRDWVKTGGSLLLIADHSPFGAAARELANRFGVDMRNVFTRDPKLAEPGGSKSHLLFSRENKHLADHPITRGRDPSERVERVLTFTGQSLKGPPGSIRLLRLSSQAVDVADRRGANPREAAGRAQGVALTLGKGRVVVLGEAAMLTAQQITRPDGTIMRFGMSREGCDNRQFALNVMHWLSGLLN